MIVEIKLYESSIKDSAKILLEKTLKLPGKQMCSINGELHKQKQIEYFHSH